MQNPFDPRAFANSPLSPLPYFQAGWQMMSSMQQAWLSMFYLPGRGKSQGTSAALADLANMSLNAAPFMAALLPFMPRIEANIMPLEREGTLAGADDAARVAMRMVMPGLGGEGAAEVLLVDAVVARAAGENALNVGRSDLPAALPKKTSD